MNMIFYKDSTHSKNHCNRGDASIFFTFTVLALITTTALVLGVIAVGTIQGTSGVESSTKAFYAADTGIENGRAQYNWAIDLNDIASIDQMACTDTSNQPVGDAAYDFTIDDGSGGCPIYGENLCFAATGRAHGSVRRAELSFGDCN